MDTGIKCTLVGEGGGSALRTPLGCIFPQKSPPLPLRKMPLERCTGYGMATNHSTHRPPPTTFQPMHRAKRCHIGAARTDGLPTRP